MYASGHRCLLHHGLIFPLVLAGSLISSGCSDVQPPAGEHGPSDQLLDLELASSPLPAEARLGDRVIASVEDAGGAELWVTSGAGSPYLLAKLAAPETVIPAMVVFGGQLYAGARSEDGFRLYRVDPDGPLFDVTPEIGGSGLETGVTALAAHGGRLYLGTLGPDDGATLIHTADPLDPHRWSVVTHDGFGRGEACIRELSSAGGMLHARTGDCGLAGRRSSGRTWSTTDGVSWQETGAILR